MTPFYGSPPMDAGGGEPRDSSSGSADAAVDAAPQGLFEDGGGIDAGDEAGGDATADSAISEAGDGGDSAD